MMRKKYVLDLHGVVPEELEMQNQVIKSKIYNLMERMIHNRIDICIAVTKKLAHHYTKKYPLSKTKYIIYSILPNNIENTPIDILELSKNKKLNVIYSGNTQPWQNIDLMLRKIKETNSDKIIYTILTGELKKMNDLLLTYNLQHRENIKVFSVEPSELSSFYKECSYGFILRDDVIINNVACPTKLIEYLNYGIIPIVLSDNIGDFKELGYESIDINDFNGNLPNRKSSINRNIIGRMIVENNIDLKSVIYSILIR